MSTLSTRSLSTILVLLVVGLVGCDQQTKHLARSRLRGSPAVELIPGVLDLRYVENHDSAFNTLRKIPAKIRRPALLAAGAIGSALLLLLLLRRRGSLASRLALAALLGGAIGNLADRAARGFVIDFIHLRFWPVFNVADSALLVGAVVLVWATYAEARRKDPSSPGEP